MVLTFPSGVICGMHCELSSPPPPSPPLCCVGNPSGGQSCAGHSDPAAKENASATEVGVLL